MLLAAQRPKSTPCRRRRTTPNSQRGAEQLTEPQLASPGQRPRWPIGGRGWSSRGGARDPPVNRPGSWNGASGGGGAGRGRRPVLSPRPVHPTPEFPQSDPEKRVRFARRPPVYVMHFKKRTNIISTWENSADSLPTASAVKRSCKHPSSYLASSGAFLLCELRATFRSLWPCFYETVQRPRPGLLSENFWPG